MVTDVSSDVLFELLSPVCPPGCAVDQEVNFSVDLADLELPWSTLSPLADVHQRYEDDMVAWPDVSAESEFATCSDFDQLFAELSAMAPKRGK